MFEKEAELVRLILCLHNKGFRSILQVNGNHLVFGHYYVRSYRDSRMKDVLIFRIDDLKQILNDYDQMDNNQFILTHGRDPFGLNEFSDKVLEEISMDLKIRNDKWKYLCLMIK